MTIKAIETKYNGCKFRSRLEARWAALFDLVGWSREYEPLVFHWYIPDFLIRNADGSPAFLVEVKPSFTTGELIEKVLPKLEECGALPYSLLAVGAAFDLKETWHLDINGQSYITSGVWFEWREEGWLKEAAQFAKCYQHNHIGVTTIFGVWFQLPIPEITWGKPYCGTDESHGNKWWHGGAVNDTFWKRAGNETQWQPA